MGKSSIMQSSRLCGAVRLARQTGLPWWSAGSTRGQLSAGSAARRDSPAKFPAAWQEESSSRHDESSCANPNSPRLVCESGLELAVSLSFDCAPVLGLATYPERLGK